MDKEIVGMSIILIGIGIMLNFPLLIGVAVIIIGFEYLENKKE